MTDLSRERGIGANCLFVELGPFRMLIDAGIDPKRVGREATPRFSKLPSNSIDFIFLTHCHLDHLGALPVAMRHHPDALVLTSRASVILAPRMLRNSCNVMKRQAEELRISEYPLYTPGEIDRLEGSLHGLNVGDPRRFEKNGEWLEVTLHRSGHVAGAVGISLVYKHRRIFFTGDVLFTDQMTLPGANFPKESCDTLVMETTRGLTARQPQRSRPEEVERLLETISKTLNHGGSVLIPTFALGRMQEVLTILHHARSQKRLPECPIFCSGLGMDLVDHLDAVARKTGLVRFRRQVLRDLGVTKLRGDLKPGKDLRPKGIYLVSSGMLVENTPSYGVAACLLEHSHNTFCFVGYCDPDTPGGKLLATAADDAFLFKTLDHVATVRASIERFDLSGHADREELVDFALQCEPRAVVLTHGDPAARDWFFDEFTDCAPHIRLFDLEPGEAHQV